MRWKGLKWLILCIFMLFDECLCIQGEYLFGTDFGLNFLVISGYATGWKNMADKCTYLITTQNFL